MFLRPFGLYFSACFGSLFVSILCTCCSHFFWYCFISFTMFCTPIFCLIHWFFSLPSFVIPSKCLCDTVVFDYKQFPSFTHNTSIFRHCADSSHDSSPWWVLSSATPKLGFVGSNTTRVMREFLGWLCIYIFSVYVGDLMEGWLPVPGWRIMSRGYVKWFAKFVFNFLLPYYTKSLFRS